MPRKSDKKLVRELAEKLHPLLRAAFLSSVDSIKSNAAIKTIVAYLQNGDIAAALRAVGLEPGAYGRFVDQFYTGYYEAGRAQVDAWPKLRLPSGPVVFRFGVRNPEAEFWLREHSSQMVTRIVEDQREAVRARMVEGLTAGENPRKTALDVVGRVNRATGRREGGILGLTVAQEGFVARARGELASGEVASLRGYLGRSRRDRRFDAHARRAIREGKPVPQEIATKMVDRYADSLLNLRGETIARTETLTALNRARGDAVKQQIIDGKLSAEDVVKVWQATGDDRTRDTHRFLHGKKVGFEEAFFTANGSMIRYPGDPEAPPSEHINCRCYLRIDVDFLASVVRNQQRIAA